jgi:hypothetical protein
VTRRLEIPLFPAALVVLVAGACLLPYRLPPSRFVTGASFEVGFNNTVAYLWFLLFLPVPVVFAARLLGRGATATERAEGAGRRTAGRVLALVVVSHVLLFAAVWAYKGRFIFAEALYFQMLLYRMTLGEVPYADFSFYYGPSMLYPAYWLTRLVGLDAGYALWFVGTYVAGLVALHALLGAALPSARPRSRWFLLLAAGLLTPWTGLNVTFLRFLLPSVVFFAVARALDRGGAARLALATLALTFAVLYSFEVAALSVAATLLVVGARLGERPLAALVPALGRLIGAEVERGATPGATASPAVLLGRAVGPLAAALLAAALAFSAIDPSGRALRLYPEIALSYSAGAHNVPIYPNLPFLTLVGLTVYAGAAGLHAIVRRWPSTDATVLVAYLILALLTQRGAFGVSEPTHFAFFGLPTLLLGLFLTRDLPAGAPARAGLAAAALVGFILPLQYYHATQVAPFFARSGGSRETAAGPAAGAAASTVEAALVEAVRSVGTDRRYLMYDLDYYSLPVYRKLSLRYPTYYTMLINSRTPEGIARTITEVRAARAIVVIRRGDLQGGAPAARAGGIRRIADTLSGAHTVGSDLAGLLGDSKARLVLPFLEFVRREYRPLWEGHGLIALGPPEGGGQR